MRLRTSRPDPKGLNPSATPASGSDSAFAGPAGGEAASSRRPGLQVVEAFMKPVQDFAVAGRQGHVELGSGLDRRLVEDRVDELGPGAGGDVAGLDMEVGMD